MLKILEVYFLLFISYAFLGWCMEVICKLIECKRFINRGFLIGPYCPIYGFGSLAITILLKKYINDPIALFVMSILICSVLEYFTSYIMEKKYHARWWDYSQKKFNLNGRICLETTIPFGLLGMLIMYIINPFLYSWYIKIPPIIMHVITAVLFIGFIVDNIISSRVVKSLNDVGSKIASDNTEEITEKVKKILREKSLLHRRLINAYPGLKNLKVKIKKRHEESKEKIKEKLNMK